MSLAPARSQVPRLLSLAREEVTIIACNKCRNQFNQQMRAYC